MFCYTLLLGHFIAGLVYCKNIFTAGLFLMVFKPRPDRMILLGLP